jgi:hypothetical protein
MERYSDLERHLDKCLNISTIEKSWVNARFGMLHDLKLNFSGAIGFYERAILVTLSDEKIKEDKADIERCKMKMELSSRSNN